MADKATNKTAKARKQRGTRNPAELLILGAGNPNKKRNPKVVTYDQAEAKQKKAIDFLERFDKDDPNDIAGMSVEEYAKHKGLTIAGEKKNPKSKVKRQRAKSKSKNTRPRRRNQEGGAIGEGKKLFRDFHGKEPKEIADLAIKTEVQKDYVFLGDLHAARFLADDGRESKIKFEGDGIKLCADPKGQQLYCIGGNQNLLSILQEQDLDTSKDLISFGRWYCVYYIAAKSLTDFQVTEWEHYFGCVEEVEVLMKKAEQDGWSNDRFQKEVELVFKRIPPFERDLPEAIYDKRNQRILFAGGSYYVDWPGIIG